MSITFKHTKKEDQHISLLNTQILKNAEKKRNNTQIKINNFVCLKAKKHLLKTQFSLKLLFFVCLKVKKIRFSTQIDKMYHLIIKSLNITFKYTGNKSF